MVVNKQTIAKLNQLNKDFYKQVGVEFDKTRQNAWPGWDKVIKIVDEKFGDSPTRFLDVGCGNGRFGEFLKKNHKAKIDYLGIDSVEYLIGKSRQKDLGEEYEFKVDDVLTSDNLWGGFDVIVAFGLIHHVPGFKTRVELLGRLKSCLNPGGVMIVAAWQFAEFERFKQKIVRWESLSKKFEVDQVEEGDYLLDWNDKGVYRYCHMVDESELERLCEKIDMKIIDSFRSDGKNKKTNLYAVLV